MHRLVLGICAPRWAQPIRTGGARRKLIPMKHAAAGRDPGSASAGVAGLSILDEKSAALKKGDHVRRRHGRYVVTTPNGFSAPISTRTPPAQTRHRGRHRRSFTRTPEMDRAACEGA